MLTNNTIPSVPLIKTVLLYSGGLDSFVQARTLIKRGQEFTPLLLDIGTKENKLEYDNAQRDDVIKDAGLVSMEPVNLAQFELDNKILPFRNLFLISIAATFGNNIIIGSTQADVALDSTETFFNKTKEVLDEFGKDSSQTSHGQGDFRIHSPYSTMTKFDYLIQFFQEFGVPSGINLLDAITKYSRSCYHVDNESRECGSCLSCVRKAAALELLVNNVSQAAGISLDLDFLFKNFIGDPRSHYEDAIDTLLKKCKAYPEKAHREIQQIETLIR